MPSDMVLEIEVVKATLRNTSIEVAFALTPMQYTHYQYLRGERVNEAMPMDQNVIGEIAALLEHLE